MVSRVAGTRCEIKVINHKRPEPACTNPRNPPQATLSSPCHSTRRRAAASANKAAARQGSHGLGLEQNQASRLLAEKSARRQEQWHHSTADRPPSRSTVRSWRTRLTGANQSRFSEKCPLECITVEALTILPLLPPPPNPTQSKLRSLSQQEKRQSALPSASVTCSGVNGGGVIREGMRTGFSKIVVPKEKPAAKSS